MKKDILSVKPKITLLSEANDIYLELTMCVLTNQTNLNNLKFTDDYINGVVNNKERFIGIPLVANREKLEQGLYGELSHEFNKKTGVLETDSIGSFVDFWSETDENGILKLMGNVRILKRYPNVCSAMIDLFESNDLEFSCEIFAYGYVDVNEDTNERSINYEYEGIVNSLFGSCIVTYPAEPMSKATILVAEALEKDFNGGEIMGNQPQTEVFNKGNNIKFYGQLETSALKSVDISNQIYNIVNPIDPKSNYRKYSYWISDVYFDNTTPGFDGYVIFEDWDDYEVLLKANFAIANDIVTLDAKDSWIEGYRGFIPKGVNVNDLLVSNKNNEIEINSRITEINQMNEEEKRLNEEQILALQSELESLKVQVSELQVTIVTQQETIQAHVANETELSSEVETLKPFKEQVETAEKASKMDKLTERYSKLLSEEVMKSEVVISAIQNLDEQTLNAIVVEHVSKEVASHTQEPVAGKVIVVAGRQEDLIPETVLQKYGFN